MQVFTEVLLPTLLYNGRAQPPQVHFLTDVRQVQVILTTLVAENPWLSRSSLMRVVPMKGRPLMTDFFNFSSSEVNVRARRQLVMR